MPEKVIENIHTDLLIVTSTVKRWDIPQASAVTTLLVPGNVVLGVAGAWEEFPYSGDDYF